MVGQTRCQPPNHASAALLCPSLCRLVRACRFAAGSSPHCERLAMPAPASIDAFLEMVAKSGLVESERLRSFLQQNAGLSSTPRKLAARLVTAGLLTRFQ